MTRVSVGEPIVRTLSHWLESTICEDSTMSLLVAAERCDPDDVATREFTEAPEERVPVRG